MHVQDIHPNRVCKIFLLKLKAWGEIALHTQPWGCLKLIQEANVEVKRSGEQISKIKQPTQMQEKEEDREITAR